MTLFFRVFARIGKRVVLQGHDELSKLEKDQKMGKRCKYFADVVLARHGCEPWRMVH